ncbi:MAG: radical SAM protein [Alphaproteobacteria bacterium]
MSLATSTDLCAKPAESVAGRVFLFYPPGRQYQRGEDRSQGNVTDSAATVMRAPNDMGYASALLKARGYTVTFRDYQTERLGIDDLLRDFRAFRSTATFLSITNSTILDDLEIVGRLKQLNPNLLVILKGSLFFDAPDEVLSYLDLSQVDYLIGGEVEFAIGDLVHAHDTNRAAIPDIPGILYRDSTGKWRKTAFSAWDPNLDELPFPDRSVINNALYVRPDTGRPQATIATSRGCPAACVYCLTPTISGKNVRFRDPANILAELRECYHQYGIKDFFFKSDTFTIDRDWVKAVCEAINGSELASKIEWVANSRVRPLADDTLQIMRDAGCWLVAFGFESGSPETLKGVRKGATVSDNIRAAKLAKAAGLKLYGFFLVGLPWEDHSHLEATARHIYDIDADFIELHIAVPYYGTELYHIAKKAGVLADTVIGKDYFHAATTGTLHLTPGELVEFRRKLLLGYHLRPGYLLRKLRDAVKHPTVLYNYARFGGRLIVNNMRQAS